MKNAFSCLGELWQFVAVRGIVIFAASVLGAKISANGATAQTIRWTGTSDEILTLETSYSLGAVASSGLPVTIRVESGPAVMADGAITVTEAGTVWVTAEQAGNGMYAPVSNARTFNLRRAVVSLAAQYQNVASAPVPLDEFDDEETTQVVGNLKYTTDENSLLVYDISNPDAPRQIAQYLDYGIDAKAIRVSGNTVYLLNYRGFLLIFKGEPTNLAVVGQSPVSGNSLDVSGDIVFLAQSAYPGHPCDGCSYNPGGIRVFNASNPGRLIEVGAYRARISPLRVQVVGDVAYALFDGESVTAFDIRLGEAPEPRLEISPPTLEPAGVVSILSAPSLPGWEVEGSCSLSTDEADWVSFGSIYGEVILEEMDGIQRRRVGNQTLFYRMRKMEFE